MCPTFWRTLTTIFAKQLKVSNCINCHEFSNSDCSSFRYHIIINSSTPTKKAMYYSTFLPIRHDLLIDSQKAIAKWLPLSSGRLYSHRTTVTNNSKKTSPADQSLVFTFLFWLEFNFCYCLLNNVKLARHYLQFVFKMLHLHLHLSSKKARRATFPCT